MTNTCHHIFTSGFLTKRRRLCCNFMWLRNFRYQFEFLSELSCVTIARETHERLTSLIGTFRDPAGIRILSEGNENKMNIH